MLFTKRLFAAALGILSFHVRVRAQDVPISITGAFQDASASESAHNSGGSVTVMGYTVQVPKNLQVTFPAAFVGWHEFVEHKGDYIGYEMEVVGNIVAGATIAAQITLTQFSLTKASGYIESVNFDGRIVLRGGPTLRINDPNAVYSVGYTDRPFFTADDKNPSITSFSGFPMCVPRNASDPLCPQSNRPNIGTSKQGILTAPDPLVMAPLVPGDFVDYSCIVIGTGEHIVYSLVASNIQITTTGSPTYIRMEAALIGVFTADQNNQEVGQTRFVGMTSDGATAVNPIQVFAIDVDPCTGSTTDRLVTSTSVSGVRNKFDVRIVKPTTPGVYTREYRITVGTGTKLTKNGILAGQYVQPVTEWIQPELTTPGSPPPKNEFSGFSHLAKGLGYDAEGVLWGPLNPFPESGVSVFDSSSCPPFVPPSVPSSTALSTSTATGPDGTTTTNPGGTTAPSVPTTLATSTTSSAPPPAATSAKVFPDLVTMPILTWASSQSGTLTVRCVSNSTDDGKVAMTLGYTNRNGITTGQAMVAGGQGRWDFTARSVKEPTQVVCKSGLGGSITVNR